MASPVRPTEHDSDKWPVRPSWVADFPTRRWTFEFKDPELEKRFYAERYKTATPFFHVVVCCTVNCGIGVLLFVLDEQLASSFYFVNGFIKLVYWLGVTLSVSWRGRFIVLHNLLDMALVAATVATTQDTQMNLFLSCTLERVFLVLPQSFLRVSVPPKFFWTYFYLVGHLASS